MRAGRDALHRRPGARVTRFVLAADGGNSKTDVVIATIDGDVRAWARGGRSSHHHVGPDGMVAVLEGLAGRARGDADLPAGVLPEVAVFMLAGVDLAGEEEDIRAALEARDLADRVVVGNDTFAVLAGRRHERLGHRDHVRRRHQLRRPRAGRRVVRYPRSAR